MTASLSLKIDEYLDAIEEAADAAEELTGSMDSIDSASSDMEASLEDVVAAIIDEGVATQEEAEKFTELSIAVAEAEAQQDDYAAALEEVIAAQGEDSVAAVELSEMLDASAEATAQARAELDEYTDSLFKAHAAEQETTNTGNEVSEALSKVGEMFKKAKKAAEGFIAVKAAQWFYEMVDSVGQFGDNIDKASQKMGMSAQAYQEWDFIAKHCGTSMDSLKSSMKTMSNAVENGNKAFEMLGMSMDDVRSMSTEDLFSAVISGLQGVEDTTTRTYIAGQLLGRGATELGALLNMSAAETEALRTSIHSLGGVMSDDAVKAAAAYEDALLDMQTAMQGIKNTVGTGFLVGLTDTYLAAAQSAAAFNAVVSGNGRLDTAKMSYNELNSALAEYSSQLDVLNKLQLDNIELADMYQPEIDRVRGKIELIKEALEEFGDVETNVIDESVNTMLPQLAEAYGEVYGQILENVQNYFGTFESGAQIQQQSVQGMIDALNEQINFNNQYADSLNIINNSGMGLEGVASAIADCGEQGAGFAVALAEAIEAGDTAKIEELKAAFEQVQGSQEGLASALGETTDAFAAMQAEAEGDCAAIQAALDALDGYSITTYVDTVYTDHTGLVGSTGGSHAGGLDYVPYHNYRAILHEGERVLTKEENKAYSEGRGGGTTNINVYTQELSNSQIDYLVGIIDRRMGARV